MLSNTKLTVIKLDAEEAKVAYPLVGTSTLKVPLITGIKLSGTVTEIDDAEAESTVKAWSPIIAVGSVVNFKSLPLIANESPGERLF